ncbi:MAG: tRNA guanosine(34) transglycosylase Tgt, partial [Patescibacteria group bacterium]
SRTGRARLGILKTPNGIVLTPAYVIVATHAEVRTLKPRDIKATGTQLVIANTYHLWEKSKIKKQNSKSYLEQKLGVQMPTMTDSGGFQVFSLGAAREQGVGKVLKRNQTSKIKGQNYSDVRIIEKGVHFKIDGKKRFISPETSVATQQRLGADIIFAFDECTSPLHPYPYTLASMERTHRWASRCLKVHTNKNQMLYGIVQGGRFKRLRAQSAKTIGTMAFDGFGIGGSFGKDEMRSTLAAVVAHLPEDKPRHLLGIGTVADIFDAIEAGVDTFDCVIPTREARHGRLYTDTGPLDVRKIKFAADRRRLLGSRSTLGALHRLFRSHDEGAGRLATLHNVRWFNLLLERIRAALADGSYRTFKRKFLISFLRP